MEPKVTLLRKQGSTYHLMYGGKPYRFFGGEERAVPVPVALECQKRTGEKGQPLFRVCNVPKLVQVVPRSEVKVPPKAADQNVSGQTAFRQLSLERLGLWA